MLSRSPVAPSRAAFGALCVLFALALPGSTRAADFATRMMEATYKLFNKDSTATGFFVRLPGDGGGARERRGLMLVTAGHVFEKMTGDSGVIVLRQPAADGTWSRRDFTFPIRASGKPLWTRHPEQDVAAMAVRLPDDARVTALPFEALATEAALKAVGLHLLSALNVLGYPTRFEANGAGFPIARHASVASFPLTPVKSHKTFLADFNTFAGDSGGPVFLPDPRAGADPENAPPLVVGIVLAQFRHDETVNSLYEERTIHYPLGLATIVHAQYLRETIELCLNADLARHDGMVKKGK